MRDSPSPSPSSVWDSSSSPPLPSLRSPTLKSWREFLSGMDLAMLKAAFVGSPLSGSTGLGKPPLSQTTGVPPYRVREWDPCVKRPLSRSLPLLISLGCTLAAFYIVVLGMIRKCERFPTDEARMLVENTNSGKEVTRLFDANFAPLFQISN
ncbi:hypothetical protein Ancab_034449 [Ancistrocladus abbreviatus]